MKKKDKQKQNVFIGTILLIAIGVLVIFALGFFGDSDIVRFRTSDLTYNYVLPQSSIAYTDTKGSQLDAYGLVAFAPFTCEGKYTYLFDIPGTLNNNPVKLYSDPNNPNFLYVCSSSGLIRYSKESWFVDDATVSIDSNSIDPELEVLF